MVFKIIISSPHQQINGIRVFQNRVVIKYPSSNFHLPLQLCWMLNLVFEGRFVHNFDWKGAQINST